MYALSYQEDGTARIVEFGRVGNSSQGEITGEGFFTQPLALYTLSLSFSQLPRAPVVKPS